ncbi:MAG: LytR/AlgR family response regulator transcription factor [Vicingaceae bacterium]
MKALIIDDEKKARNLLATILQESCDNIIQINEAEDLPSGVVAIRKENPDIVFLDVEMPQYLGTQILDFFDVEEVNFHIVFTTAYSDYALKAFEINAIDYLLKPLRVSKVKEAIDKALEKKSENQISNQLEALKTTLSTKKITKIGLPITDGIQFVKLNSIFYFKADGMYTQVYTTNSSPLLISKPLKHFVEILSDVPEFFKTHRSYLINKNFINQLVKKDGGYIVMDNDEKIAVSKDKMNELSGLKEI